MDFKDSINSACTDLKINAVCVVGGSFAKGTNLEDDFDIDFFLKFSKKYKDEELSDLTEKILKKSKLKFLRVHGSRDYFHFEKGKKHYEVVPVFNIKKPSDAINITDVSPLHVDYIRNKLKKPEDVRLAKKFCKAGRVYGAESYINGFSGHVLELLIIHYGSFKNLLRRVSSWKPKVIIDIEKKVKDPLKNLNSSKIMSPLILIDPIQPSRNAAAALSLEKFNKFKELAKKYLKKPSNSFFKIKKLDFNKFKKRKNALKIVLVPVDSSKDISGTKAFKALQFLLRSLEENNFNVVYDWEFDKKFIIFIAGNLKSENIIVMGPPLSREEDCKKFLKKRKNTYKRNNRLFSKEKVKFKTLKSCLRFYLKDEYVTSRIKRVESVS